MSSSRATISKLYGGRSTVIHCTSAVSGTSRLSHKTCIYGRRRGIPQMSRRGQRSAREQGPEIHPHYFPLDSRGIPVRLHRETARTFERSKRGHAVFASLNRFYSFLFLELPAKKYYKKALFTLEEIDERTMF